MRSRNELGRGHGIGLGSGRGLRIGTWLGTTALMGSLGLAGCHSGGEETAAPSAVPVTLGRVEKRDLADTVSVAGALDALPGLDVKLAPLSPGRLQEVKVAEGDAVQANQLLARLDPAPFEDVLHQAEAAVAESEAAARNDAEKLSRAEKLFDAGVSARQEVDDARTQSIASQQHVRTAEAALSTARLQFARSELRAPFAGVAARLFAAPGEPVDSGKPVVEVARIDELELRAGVPLSVARRLAAGQPAEILTTDAAENAPRAAGVVFAIAPAVDPATGSTVVRIRVKNPGTLRLGETARAVVRLANRTGVPAVPKGALVPAEENQGNQLALVTVDAEHKTHKVAVQVGAIDQGYAELLSGPPVGQQVVVGGAYALPDGTSVTAAGEQDAGASR